MRRQTATERELLEVGGSSEMNRIICDELNVMRCACHIGCLGDAGNACRILIRKPEKSPLL